MPNWCYNSLTLSHEDVSKIDALEAELNRRDEAEVLQHLRPNPSGEWEYDWSVSNWGTKWDITPYDWERVDSNTIQMSFDSAWSPPTAIYYYLETQGWSVSALYHEPGMGFAGKYEDGYDDFYEYEYNNRESIESLPEEILEFTNLMQELEDWEAEQQENEE